ncbi:MAG: alpha-L-fucosidase [Clostridia bacterium]|nr:alpha-L-fucosidase [Clostridia bacterium]
MNIVDREKKMQEIDQVIAQGPYQDNWASLSHYEVPEWYKKAKFGIFIHWGVYAVPAFNNEWYPRNMYISTMPEYQHHIDTYGPHKDFGYKDFISLFKAEKFDPDAWAALFEEAGARYVIPVAEHHDGFQMYKSDLSEWNAAEKGPCRDTTQELQTALSKRGIPMGVSSHRFEHWFFLGHGKEFDSDVKEPLHLGDLYWPSMPEGDTMDSFSEPAPSPEFCQDWLLRCCELVDRFHPPIVYFDWWIHHSALRPYLKKFVAYYYNRAAEGGFPAAINYKHDSFIFGSAVPDVERGHFADVKPYFWQTCTAIAKNSWCYTEQNQYKAPYSLICDLIDVASKNGTMLLNVGPKADGTIGPEDTAVLKAIGRWLKVNGEAIYDTAPWRLCGEGPTQVEEGFFTEKDVQYTPQDFRFTMKEDHLYATALAFPADGQLTIKTLAQGGAHSFVGMVKDVAVLGYAEAPAWHRDPDGLHISAPFVHSDMPVSFRITLE